MSPDNQIFQNIISDKHNKYIDIRLTFFLLFLLMTKAPYKPMLHLEITSDETEYAQWYGHTLEIISELALYC